MPKAKKKSLPKSAKKGPEQEILPPKSGGDTYNFQAFLTNHSHRPDLFFDAIEKHAPGTVRRILRQFGQQAKDFHKATMMFFNIQGFIILIVNTVFAVVLLGIFSYHAFQNTLGTKVGIFLLVAIVILLSGVGGVVKLIAAFAQLISRSSNTDK